MVREGDHSGGVSLSSIALLQERFRQLQKIKELRQEKELLRLMLFESERHSPNIILSDHELDPKTVLGFEKMLLFHPRPDSQLSLSIWPDSQNKNASFSSYPAKALFSDATLVCNSRIKVESYESDIDTSLRL